MEDPAKLTTEILNNRTEAEKEAVFAFYRDLHQNPELAHQEHRTAGKVAEQLKFADYSVTTGVGGTGVVGVMENGDGPTVLLRGDMDGLPIEEATGVEYSGKSGMMHACGHDVHTTCLVNTAKLLSEYKDRWNGTVIICAQPAEETATGAAAMVEDGLMTRFPRPDVCLAQHVVPLREGHVSHTRGVILSAAVNVRIRIVGQGGHASEPEKCVDPVITAAYLATRLQTIVSRELPPREPAVVSVSMIHAGVKPNIISNEAELTVNIRARSNDMKDKIVDSVARIARGECLAGGCGEPEITRFSEFPVTINNVDVVDKVSGTHKALPGLSVFEGPGLNGSEDFSEFGIPGPGRYAGEPIPYAFWFLGIRDHEEWDQFEEKGPQSGIVIPGNHTDRFAPSDPEKTLTNGTATLLSAALSYLA